MTRNEKTNFKIDKTGWKLEIEGMAGKEISDEQARTLVLAQLAEGLDGLGASFYVLAQALEKHRL